MKTNQLWVIFWQIIAYTILMLNVFGISRIHNWGSYLDLKNYICCAAKKELKIYRTGAANDFCIFGYFKNEQDAQRAIDLFGDEIIELFVDCEGE